jgi:chromate transporter
MLKRPSLPELFLAFFRLGLTSFGGPAMIAYIKDLSVTRKHWLDDETFRNGVALCQLIPGATAMQTAAYVGLSSRGIPGALATFTGFGLPAFIFMLTLSVLYSNHNIVPWVKAVFLGLQVAVVSIVANAAYSFGRTTLHDYFACLIALGAAALFWAGISPFIVIILAAVAGIVFYSDADSSPALKPDSENDNRKLIRHFLLLPVVAASLLLSLYFIDRDFFVLAALMMKIDVFAFGGGFASLPLMLHQIVDVNGWMDYKTFIDGIALGQVTPGPIVITATFVGYIAYGVAGAFVATIAIFMPSFLLVVGTAPVFERLKGSPYFVGGTRGTLASFVGLLLFVTIKFGLALQWDILSVILAAAVFLALRKKVEILYIVPVVAAISALLF